MNLENMSIKELVSLQSDITSIISAKGDNLKFNKLSTFLDEQKVISNLESEINSNLEKIERINTNSDITSIILDLGYSIVYHEHTNNFNFLNFSKDKIDDEYVGFYFNVSERDLYSEVGDISLKEDYVKIKEILGL